MYSFCDRQFRGLDIVHDISPLLLSVLCGRNKYVLSRLGRVVTEVSFIVYVLLIRKWRIPV
jgi:hypothetical protein